MMTMERLVSSTPFSDPALPVPLTPVVQMSTM
jgi:hypothetical protein